MTIKIDYNGESVPLYPSIDFKRGIILHGEEEKVHCNFKTLVPVQRDGVWYAVYVTDSKVFKLDDVPSEYDNLIYFNKYAMRIMEKYIIPSPSSISDYIKLSHGVLSTIKESHDMDGGDYDFIKKSLFKSDLDQLYLGRKQLFMEYLKADCETLRDVITESVVNFDKKIKELKERLK